MKHHRKYHRFRYYTGPSLRQPTAWVVFQSTTIPTGWSHGDVILYAHGPFTTKKDAIECARWQGAVKLIRCRNPKEARTAG